MATVQCIQCGVMFNVVPARLSTAKFCSYACRGAWRKVNYRGDANPRWTGGVREKHCQRCGVAFRQNPTEAISTFAKRKFCTKACADVGGFRYSGKDHPNYREEARRRNRGQHHHKWVNAVISRDKATCQHCGAVGVELHAHHIKSFRDHPELRFDVSNGITLCYKCHWAVHTALDEKAVNSGNIPPGNAEDNPEPSLRGNLLEGVTTRGRAYRRWVGPCVFCGNTVSRRLSDVKGRKAIFCNHSCAMKFTQARLRKERDANGSNASTSAAPERDEIV
jgi:5-methylcytosine-specific restriction endonuclease McrA